MALYAGDPDNYPASADLPGGGTQRNAGSVRIGDEAALDRTAYLNKARPTLQGVSVDATSDTDPNDLHQQIGGTNPDVTTTLLLTIPDCEVGEILDIRCQLAWRTNGANVRGRARYKITEDVGGANTVFQIDSSKVWIQEDTVTRHDTLLTVHEVAAAGDVKVQLEVKGTAGNGGGSSFDTGSDRIRILKGSSLQVWRYRHGVTL